MLDKTFDKYKFLFSGIIACLIGISIILFRQVFLFPVLEYTGLFMMVKGTIEIILDLIHKKVHKRYLAYLLGGFILYYIDCIPFGITIIYVIYIGIFCFVKLFSFFQYNKYNVPGKKRVLIHGLLYLLMIIIILTNPTYNLRYISLFAGIIITLYGLKNIFFSLSQIIPKKARKYLRQANRFPIPDIVAIFYPAELTHQIHTLVKENNTKEFMSDKEKSDLQIYLHLSPRGLEALGHMELAFEGNIISYANYDRHSRRLFDIAGDGVMVKANQEKYLNYHVNMRDRYLVEFGIVLTNEEKKRIRKKINKLFHENNKEYYSDKQRALRGEIEDRLFRDMSSEIYMYADGIFKKYTSGINKVFSIPRNNCVYFMDQILNEINIKIYSINGFMSPGAYYDYFNYLYRLDHTNVVSRRIYIKGCEIKCQNFLK